jgi:APA family basic amino acid/polyamine antiporter
MTDANVILELGSFKLKAGQLVSVLIVIFLTYFNTRGLQGGKIIQTLFTGAKLIALFGIIIFGFLLAGNSQILHSNFTAPIVTALEPATTTTPFLGILAMAMVGSVFSSDAWNNITFIAGEVKNPQRNIALSLVLGTGIVTLIYILANLMYLYVLPLDAIAHATDDRVGVTASSAIFGTSGAYILAVLVMVSTFGCNNGLILSGARVYYAMAKDCLFFKKAATLNKQAVPQWALWMQCLWACLLCLSGRYGDLLDYVVFVVLVFYILTIAGIFILRRTQPNTPRPYKAWGYPVLPIMYIIMASVMCVCLLIYKPAAPIFGIQGFNANPCVVGLFIVLLGIPVYYLTLSKKQP